MEFEPGKLTDDYFDVGDNHKRWDQLFELTENTFEVVNTDTNRLFQKNYC